jgi:hypothetical protein
MGLEYLGFGRWGKRGRATHIENDDRSALVQLKKPERIVNSPKLRQKNLDLMHDVKSTDVWRDERLKNADEKVKNVFNKLSASFERALAKQHKWDEATGTSVETGYAGERYLPLNRYNLDKLIQDSHHQFEALSEEEQAAVINYTGSSYDMINGALRRAAKVRKLVREKGPKEEIKNQARAIDRVLGYGDEGRKLVADMASAFKHFKLSQDVVVFRGISEVEAELAKANKHIDVQQYLSTSIDPAFAHGWTRNLLILRVPKKARAVFAAGYSENAHESEMILDRGMQIKIRHIAPIIQKRYYEDAAYMMSYGSDKKPTKAEIKAYIIAHPDTYHVRYKYYGEIVGFKKEVTDAMANDLKAYANKYNYKSKEEKAEEARIAKEQAEEQAPETPPGTALYDKAVKFLETTDIQYIAPDKSEDVIPMMLDIDAMKAGKEKYVMIDKKAGYSHLQADTIRAYATVASAGKVPYNSQYSRKKATAFLDTQNKIPVRSAWGVTTIMADHVDQNTEEHEARRKLYFEVAHKYAKDTGRTASVRWVDPDTYLTNEYAAEPDGTHRLDKY